MLSQVCGEVLILLLELQAPVGGTVSRDWWVPPDVLVQPSLARPTGVQAVTDQHSSVEFRKSDVVVPELRLRNEFPSTRRDCWQSQQLREGLDAGFEIRNSSGRVVLAGFFPLPQEYNHEGFHSQGVTSATSNSSPSYSVVRLEIPKIFWEASDPYTLRMLWPGGQRSQVLFLRGKK